jgi:hypothetical protein
MSYVTPPDENGPETAGDGRLLAPVDVALRARPWLASLAEDFRRGMEHARRSAITHDLVTSIGLEREFASVGAVVNEVLGRIPNLPDQIRASLVKTAGEFEKVPGVKAEKERLARARLAELEANPATQPVLLWIRQAGLVRAWASLEALAEDMWTESLNRAGPGFRQGAFTSVLRAPDVEDSANLSGKQIQMSVLAKHGFNLSDKLGLVLAPKCSFKTVDGITNAFKAAFGWKKGTPPPSFPNSDELRRVEWKRHVIVHRGGTIDAAYVQSAGLPDEEVGKPLEIGPDAIFDDINLVQSQGGRLLGRLALWLDAVEPIGSA